MAPTLTALGGGLDSTISRELAVLAGAPAPPGETAAHPRPAGLVPRPRLVRRLIEARDVPVARLVAPAGYGKTALMSEWAASDGRPFAWVTLEQRDNDPRALLSAVAVALDAIEPVGDEVFEALSSRRRERIDVALQRLTGAIESRQVAAVLVLDDLHLLRAKEARDAVAAIARACGHGLQLALASRSDSVLPAARLRAHGHSVELRASELAMTRSEAAAVLRRVELGLSLSAEQVLDLHGLTEGWPAGLHLAALFLHDQREGGIGEFRGDDRAVTDYVREEMLSSLRPDERDFVVATSVLDRITAPLCNALLGRGDAADMLARLSRGDVMLVPLDRSGASYRYHELFAAALRAELRRLQPERALELHSRASAWYAANGDPERAIGHAIDAGDTERAATLLWENALTEIARAGRAPIAGWLDRLGAAAVADTPLLCLVAAAGELAAGDFYEAERWTTLARTAPGDEVTRGGIALLQAGIGRHGLADLASDAGTAAELLGERSSWRPLCLLLCGVADLLRDAPGARALLEESAHLSAARAPLVQVLSLAQLALLAEDEDDFERASALIARARAQVTRCALGDCPTVALVFAASAALRARSGQAGEASADLRHAQELLAEISDPGSWYEVECLVVAARATLGLSGPAAARELVARALRASRRIPDAPLLRRWLDGTAADVELALDACQGAEWNLTAAELRVLRHLPSHLSFREIADRLYVSQNTAKTHARGIYRKLGVSSRGEAVELARRAGLVERTGP